MYFIYLFITILLELPIYVRLSDNKRQYIILLCILLNISSHPAATLLVAYGYLPLLIAELLVFIFELIFFKIGSANSWKNSIVTVFTANAVTTSLGLIITYF